ncbi:MAG TPA: hypothetical protein VFX14_20205 [Methylomirabilota bacterium]|nr:hypothetical protein [Methylomirabilota bacterium]
MNFLLAIAVLGMALVSAVPALATPQLLTEAKKAGMPAKNCQYCHTIAMPKKESFKTDQLNDRGKWMMDEKGKKNSKDIKAEWLMDYPGGKEQK